MNFEQLFQSGVFLVQIQHDHGCPTPRTQRDTDCTCKSVDVVSMPGTDANLEVFLRAVREGVKGDRA